MIMIIIIKLLWSWW